MTIQITNGQGLAPMIIRGPIELSNELCQLGADLAKLNDDDYGVLFVPDTLKFSEDPEGDDKFLAELIKYLEAPVMDNQHWKHLGTCGYGVFVNWGGAPG